MHRIALSEGSVNRISTYLTRALVQTVPRMWDSTMEEPNS